MSELTIPMHATGDRPTDRDAIDMGNSERRERKVASEFEVRELIPSNEDDWHKYGLLRAKAYASRGLIDESDINEFGEEFDKDDWRSSHFGVFNDAGDLIGCTRLIEKFHDVHPLPVEGIFGIDAHKRSVEASRLVVDKDVVRRGTLEHEMVYLTLVRVMMYQAMERGSEYVYATVEASLRDHLRQTGMTVEQLVDEPVNTYNTDNYAVRIKPSAIIDRVSEADLAGRPRRTPEMAGFLRKAAVTKGLGRAAVSDLVVDKRQFERNIGLMTPEEQERLGASHIAIAGTGGDGGQLAIDMARLGVQRFTLADPEDFGIENLNRQAGSSYDTVGRNKAEVVAEEIYRINPHAKIKIFRSGVTEDNIREFVKGADLVFDETEYTTPEIGVMIARASREEGIPVSMVLNVGHGARLMNFDPRGETLESWLGIDEESSIEDIRQLKHGEDGTPALSTWIGRLPKYVNTDAFADVAAGGRTAPSLSTGVSIASGAAATQAMSILLADITPSRSRDIVWAPDMGLIDAVESIKRINPKSTVGFALSALRAKRRTARGDNPGFTNFQA